MSELPSVDPQSPVRGDERVLFFRSFAHRLKDEDAWTVPVHGWIFEPEEDSLRRRAALHVLRKSLGLERHDAAAETFLRRARAFVVDNERDKRLAISLGATVWRLPASAADGHFEASLTVDGDQLAAARSAGVTSRIGWRVLLGPGDARSLEGEAEIVDRDGVSVVSDIDDTIKDTRVLDTRELLANTFLRDYRAVDGMSELYSRWAASGASFHYLSGSPWQLYEPLVEFLGARAFPGGSFHLRRFRLRDRSLVEFLRSPRRHKERVLPALLHALPRRRFVLVGDTGEDDPPTYAAIARRFRGRIVRVLLRAVPGGAGDLALRRAFAGVPDELWQVFRNPGEIAAVPGL